jgi:hypothetical protein
MIFNEKKGNLFELNNDKYFYAHCISSDYRLGLGIAIEFQKRFNLRNALKQFDNKYPEVIIVNHVFNLVTKDKYWNKPTYDSITKCIEQMAVMCKNLDIKYLAMPKIGCGLDKLNWFKVREIIKEKFADVDIQIEVRYL